jgi:endonuclease/exonuclease/phosphatase (EEP) superfamily protein YafD
MALREALSDLEMPENARHRGVQVRAKTTLAAAALFTLLGTLGGAHWLLELFSHFIAWHAMLAGAAALQFFLIRRWRWSLIACAVMAAQLSVPLYWYLPGDTTTLKPNLRVLLANVHTANSDKQSFLDLVKASDPDVICVQETDDAWAEALEVIEADYPVHSIVPRSDNFGIAFYSRLPGAITGVLFQKEHQVPALSATITVEGRSIAILDIHTLPPMGYFMARHRRAQLESARQWLATQTDPALLIGDLNLTMFSPEYYRFTKDLDLHNARKSFGPLGTWPAWVPFARLPLDHCLVRGDLAVVNCAAGPNIGSDHLPLIIDLHVASR